MANLIFAIALFALAASTSKAATIHAEVPEGTYFILKIYFYKNIQHFNKTFLGMAFLGTFDKLVSKDGKYNPRDYFIDIQSVGG